VIRRCLAAVICTLAAATASVSAQSSYDELSRFSAVVRHISDNHADSVTYRSLVRAGIDGMLRSLDPHSWFLPSEDADKYNALERGELAVTGIEIELADAVPTVIAVTDGSPAAGADVRPGDRVISVGGEPTAGLTAKVVALRLAGERGTRVRVELERGARLEPDSVAVTLRREMPKPEPSVLLTRMIDDSTGLVRLGQFGEKSADELRKSVRSLRGEGMKRLVLDLRGNPGGIVTEAVAMAARFLPANTLVFTTRGRQRSANEEFRTSGGGEFRDLPLVVLIDEHSASASEALAASLQDHDRAVIAGRRSFGKALMQTGFLVPNGFVQLTIGHVISPSGRFIQRPYQGLAIEQYRAFAGDSSRQDTTAVFRTAAGRIVRGGGGVAPDVALPAPPALPRWFTVAADSGWVRAVADSVAFTLATTPEARAAWLSDSGAWQAALVEPLMARIRSRLNVSARNDAALNALLGRRLAARAAVVRWDESTGLELLVASDPDVRAAVGLFGTPLR
jgi:carboxyl-terminal processing protease